MKTYELSLDIVRQLNLVVGVLQRHDPDLARQLKRSRMSMPLNINEGMYSRGRNRAARLTDAMGSAKECVAVVQGAQAAGYLSGTNVDRVLDDLDHLVGALWNMVHRPWR